MLKWVNSVARARYVASICNGISVMARMFSCVWLVFTLAVIACWAAGKMSVWLVIIAVVVLVLVCLLAAFVPDGDIAFDLLQSEVQKNKKADS